MKKLILLILITLFLSGCSIQKVNNNDYVSLMNKILSFNIKYRNEVSNGYDYYLPKGVTKVESSKYNDVLKRNNNLYYLYADVVRYYYKEKIEYKEKKESFYSSKITNEEKEGYLQIDKTDKSNNELYVQMFYNYAKIETYVDKKDLTQTISDLSYILSSINYNDVVLAKEYSLDSSTSKEETYTLFKDKEKTGNFLEYIKEYDKYEESDSNSNGEVELRQSNSATENN